LTVVLVDIGLIDRVESSNIDPGKRLKTATEDSLVEIIHMCIPHSENSAVFV
jgi:hypothetical protein